jgi:hypothetical protein
VGKKKKQERVQINAPLAYVQAVESLYVAKKMALEHKDYASLIDIANSWIEIGNHMLTAEVELVYDDETAATYHSEEQSLIGFGFTGGLSGEETTQPAPGADEDRD